MSKPDAAAEAAANLATPAEDDSGIPLDPGVGEQADDAAAATAPGSIAGEEDDAPRLAEADPGRGEGPTVRDDATEADEGTTASSSPDAAAEPAVGAESGSTGAVRAEATDHPVAAAAEQGEREATESAATEPAANAPAANAPVEPSRAAHAESAEGAEPPAADAGGTAAGAEEEGALAPASPELEAIVAAHTTGERLEGRVIGWNKGGFHVVVNGVVPAFCPKSQIEIDNPKRAAAYVDRTFAFKVLEIKDHGKRVVLTRRQVLVEDREAALERLRQKRASGEPIDGKVTSITEFGAFVDVGGLEGLVHLSQLSRRRVDNAREVVQVGQDVQVKVLKIEKGGDRISLSMKALEPDPWHTVTERFETGSQFEGTILRKAEFGLFVDVGDGLEGLIHSSNLELGKSLDSADYAEGSKVQGWVREVDPERRRLALSLREVAQTNPWSDIRSRYSEGSEVNGRVEQVARFGVFVEIEPGLTGLLPFSSLPEIQGPRPTRQFRPGETIDVVVDAIDVKRRRISLAPLGSKLEGTKSDYREYQKKQTSGSGLGALAAAFEKIQQGG